jgi:hypothetical protein
MEADRRRKLKGREAAHVPLLPIAAAVVVIRRYRTLRRLDPPDEGAGSRTSPVSPPIERLSESAPDPGYARSYDVGVQQFATSRDARQFLIDRIVEQAQRGGIDLTDAECKMLYFSETGWTLPDISAVNDVFDRDCDQATYEAKIAALVREIQARNGAEGREHSDAWDEALA